MQLQLYSAWSIADLCQESAGHSQLVESGVIHALLTMASCVDGEVKLYSATALALLCETEEIAVLMVSEGLLQALIPLASSEDGLAQVEVARCFASISRFSANTEAIATSGCLQPLLGLMVGSHDASVKIACAQALGNLAEHREARELITNLPIDTTQ